MKTYQTARLSMVLVLGLGCTALQPADSADVVINEFMAVNKSAYTNNLGETPDWIELYNTTASNIDLTGWHLTDDPRDLTKWTFPATNIAAYGYLLVFADNSATPVISGYLHANLKLDADGEYLGLVRPDSRTIEDAYDPAFPPQEANISYGICTNICGGFGYFTNATPGTANGLGFMDFVADTKFEPNCGLYTNPVVVAMTCLTAGADIHFTTNFELPTPTSVLYEAAIAISNSTVFRAEANKPGYLPSRADSRTYIFLDDVLRQSANPPDFPAEWNGTLADYGMDETIVGDPVFGPMMTNALRSLPSMFVVTDKSNLFNSASGIYVNSYQRSKLWERPASLTWVLADNATAFSINCGLRIQGGAFRSMGMTKKHSFRVLFKADYGPTKLDYDLYGDPSATRSFDTLILRGGGNDAWNRAGGARTQYIADEFARRSHIAMGHPSPHGTYAHLYLDGLYWGLYNVCERVSERFARTYFGIPETNCDVMAIDECKEGSRTAWDTLVTMCNAGVGDNASYQRIQGNNPDRTRNMAYPDYLDVDSYIDYLMVRMWVADADWPKNNWHCFRNHDPATSTGFKFAVWDAEEGTDVWGGLGTDRTSDGSGVCGLYMKLLDNAEFRLQFADHIQKHMFNGGPLTTNQTIPRYKELAELVQPAIVAESARWGDQGRTRYTLTHWQIQTNKVMTTFLVQRNAEVLQQFKHHGLYPSISAPVYNRHGGLFTKGFRLTMTASNTIYYTLSGTDPREYGTGQPVGAQYTAPIALSSNVLVRARARGGLSNEWSALEEAYFVLDEPNLLRITELMYHPHPPTDTNLPPSEYEFIELQNTGTKTISLAGTKFTDGICFDFTHGSVRTLEPGVYVLIVKNLAAFKSRYPNWQNMTIAGEFQQFREFPVANLSDSGERVTLADGVGSNIFSFTYSDGQDWPAAADGAGHSLVPLTMTNQAEGALDCAGNWRASASTDGSPGKADSR